MKPSHLESVLTDKTEQAPAFGENHETFMSMIRRLQVSIKLAKEA
jgi:hypothetical protein